MMEVIVNGQPHSCSASASVLDLLAALGFEGKPMLVEHNAQALLARELTTTPLQPGDRIEVIQIVAGG
jgi:sulfur carrier protein